MARTDFDYRTGRILRNRAAQDATLINIRTLKKRVSALERECKALRNELNQIRFKTRR